MNRLLTRLRRDEDGVLTFEWVLLITLVVIGIVGGVAALRDGIIDELGDMTEAVVNIDQSFTIQANPRLGLPGFQYNDQPAPVNRGRGLDSGKSQGPVIDSGAVQ